MNNNCINIFYETRYNRIFVLKPTQLQQRPKVICQACTGNDNNESCLGAHINQRNKWFYTNDQCVALWLFIYTWLSLCIVFIIFRGILIDLMGWWYCLLSWKDSHTKKIQQNLPTVLKVAKSQGVGSCWAWDFEQ